MTTIVRIQEATAREFGFTREYMLSRNRNRALAHARQTAMWLTRHLGEYSYLEIARAFRMRDHTTVLHAVVEVTRRRSEDQELRDRIDRLMSRIANNFPESSKPKGGYMTDEQADKIIELLLQLNVRLERHLGQERRAAAEPDTRQIPLDLDGWVIGSRVPEENY